MDAGYRPRSSGRPTIRRTSTPLVKSLVAGIPPVLLAGLLYAGYGLGLWLLIRRLRPRVADAEVAGTINMALFALGEDDSKW